LDQDCCVWLWFFFANDQGQVCFREVEINRLCKGENGSHCYWSETSLPKGIQSKEVGEFPDPCLYGIEEVV
jgi:hypothetical protein